MLQSEIGHKAGETLKEQAVGIDRKPLNYCHERKSVSAEVNYGIRFKSLEECQSFLQSLSNEVYKRLSDINMKARCVTLKLLVRSADAPLVSIYLVIVKYCLLVLWGYKLKLFSQIHTV